jgi:hypothetical protein
MKLKRYEYTTGSDSHNYVFESIGIKGKIKKIVQYTEMNIKGYYNLGFGDFNERTLDIDDKVLTNNGDARKVLATVVSTLYAFTAKFPEYYVFATGSTESRTRLYKMGISNHYEELKNDFEVYGLTNEEIFEEFRIGKDYIGFLVKRKFN